MEASEGINVTFDFLRGDQRASPLGASTARDASQVTGQEPEHHWIILVLRADSLERGTEELDRASWSSGLWCWPERWCDRAVWRGERDGGGTSPGGGLVARLPHRGCYPGEREGTRQVRRVGELPAGTSREQEKDPHWACGAPLGPSWGAVMPGLDLQGGSAGGGHPEEWVPCLGQDINFY
ncbi:hypothetical protein NDU88_007204 [Pleurodeles waltl]|uniref:Uncharacterized protein n=1 Tax=Pleurodeles waltl TaxID=8319 RepID=A0AAV7UPZ5_PLEWA|nr:hypothetical protein NDU88_007204 [Pleurodeles waltl]